MNEDVELPPLPEPVQIDKHLPTGVVIRGYTKAGMQSYARAAILADRERHRQRLAQMPQVDAGWVHREARNAAHLHVLRCHPGDASKLEVFWRRYEQEFKALAYSDKDYTADSAIRYQEPTE